MDYLRELNTDDVDDEHIFAENTTTRAPRGQERRHRTSERPRSILSPGGRNQEATVRRNLLTRDDNPGEEATVRRNLLTRDDNPGEEGMWDSNIRAPALGEDSNDEEGSYEEDSHEDSQSIIDITTRPRDNTFAINQRTQVPGTQNAGEPVTAPAPPASPPHASGSALTRAALTLMQDSIPETLAADLSWQQEVKGDPTKVKTFRNEALQRSDLLVFVYMRPASSFIHLLHTAGTFSLPSGDEHYRGKDIAFVGDRTHTCVPTPVQLAPEQPWKWITKKMSLDPAPLELFYAVPENANKLYHPVDRTGEYNVTLPRLLALPPPLVCFCAQKQCTPFQLYQHVVSIATDPQATVTMANCGLLIDWCIMAAHHDTVAHTSLAAFSLDAAISTDDTFHRWLQRRLVSVLGMHQQPGLPKQPQQQASFPVPPQQPQQPHSGQPQLQFAPPPGVPPNQTFGMPPQQMWAQFAASITQGMAAALQPGSTPLLSSVQQDSYETGGKLYDKYQLSVVRGFSHQPGFSGVQPIWALFQQTKHAETHKNNIKRKMAQWADAQRPPVIIDRGLYITNASLKDILALRFNPGNTMADVTTADQGISLLMCRARSSEGKSAVRRKELILSTVSRTNMTLADAEKVVDALEPTVCPEGYNDLTKCLGTYCALLYTLFGPRCKFFRHCHLLLKQLCSERVADRQRLFTPLFCRQIVWAIVEDG